MIEFQTSKIENGFQIEKIYNSFEYNDPWCVPCKGDKVKVSFSDGDVWAVPYDMPIISFKTRKFSTLRLWQCKSINEFDFALFSEQKYTKSLEEKNNAEMYIHLRIHISAFCLRL